MSRFAPLLLLFAACASTTTTSTPCNPGHTILNATLWVQSSAEYRAAATQTFAAARRALDEALADPARVGALEEMNEDPSQPPAVIVDVDETVLDNTPFERA
jgi:acid phosphatase